MTRVIFFILQLGAVFLDLFFFPSLFPSQYWIDISIVVFLGGLSLLESTFFVLSIPLLLLKFSFLPHNLILPIFLAYSCIVLFYYIFQKVFQISSLVLFQTEIVFLFPIYLLLVSQFVSLSIWTSFIIQILVVLMIPYPILLYLKRRILTQYEKRRILS
jgi:hypothetical protein